MPRHRLSGRWLVLVIAIAMLTITMPSLATHNSLGPHTSIVVNDGEKEPAYDPASDVAPRFHEDAVEDGLIPEPRIGPQDHAGDSYDKDKCDAYGEGDVAYQEELDRLGNEVDSDTPHEDRETSICWVGYFDVVYQYILVSNQGFNLANDLYPVNPAPDDGYCRGEEDQSGVTLQIPETGGEIGATTGIEPVDVALTNLWRVGDDDCQGGGHDAYTVPGIGIDRALLEAPVQNDDFTPGLEEELENEGSISQTFPGYTRAYTLLFGQPHPSNANATGISVEDPPFTETPGDFTQGTNGLSTIIGDLSNACEDRTKACDLLNVEDVQLYDANHPDVDGDDSFARICEFLPQFVATDGVAELEGGICGPVGDAQEWFEPDAGGLGIEDGPPTFISTLPGFWSVWHNIETPYVSLGASFSGSYTDDEGSYTGSFYFYHAINPKVPEPDHSLWCAVPGFLTHGTGVGPSGAQLVEESEDPGLYGPYQADAMDVHFAHFTVAPIADDLHAATHPTVRSVLGPAQDVTGEGLDSVNELLNDSDVEVPEEVSEGIDRADPAGPGLGDKPYNVPTSTQNDFQISLDPGIACTAAAQPSLQDGSTLDGGLLFDTSLSQETIVLKDPTVFDDEDLPEKQSESDRGTWQTDVYSFSGLVKGVVDSDDDGALNDCPDAGGSIPEDQDRCVWQPYWDVYNSNCETFGADTLCGEQMGSNGYAIDGSDAADGIGGVGLFFGLQVSGPVLVTDTSPTLGEVEGGTFQDRTTVLGDQDDPLATHCVIGTSQEFDEFLLAHFIAEDETDLVSDLCPDADGEVHFIPDAFSDQGSLDRGEFSGAFEWAPLAPTPDAGVLEQGDQLCIASLWSIQSGIAVTSDTDGDLQHEPGDSPIVYGECLDLSTTSSDHAAWNPLQ